MNRSVPAIAADFNCMRDVTARATAMEQRWLVGVSEVCRPLSLSSEGIACTPHVLALDSPPRLADIYSIARA
jgi:hypothetical protein